MGFSEDWKLYEEKLRENYQSNKKKKDYCSSNVFQKDSWYEPDGKNEKKCADHPQLLEKLCFRNLAVKI